MEDFRPMCKTMLSTTTTISVRPNNNIKFDLQMYFGMSVIVYDAVCPLSVSGSVCRRDHNHSEITCLNKGCIYTWGNIKFLRLGKEHWSYSGCLWWSESILTRFMLVFPLTYLSGFRSNIKRTFSSFYKYFNPKQKCVSYSSTDFNVFPAMPWFCLAHIAINKSLKTVLITVNTL